MKILQNKLAVEICRCLQNEGHEALLVGGCVRDSLVGDVPKDFDVATSAEPAEVESACKKFKLDLVGRAFGVVIASGYNDKVEIATFRSDGVGRKPEVKFVSNIQIDADRRDFTINALYFDPIKEIAIDPTGGIDDLDAKIIRTPGNARDRIKEDVLRTLRAIRFASRFNFKIDKPLWDAIVENSSLVGVIEGDLIGRIPQERVIEEFKKAINSNTSTKNKVYLNLLKQSGLWENMFPGAAYIEVNQSKLFAHDMTRNWEGFYKSQGDFIKALGFGGDEVTISNLVNYIKSVVFDHSNFSKDKTIKAFNILGEELIFTIVHDVNLSKNKELDSVIAVLQMQFKVSTALIQFAKRKLQVNGDDVMKETGLLPGKELGDEIARRDLATFKALVEITK